MTNQNKTKFVSFRTDLACEASIRCNENLAKTTSEDYEKNNIFVTKTYVDKTDEARIGKKAGTYYTIDFSEKNFHDAKNSKEIEIVIMEILEQMLQEKGVIGKRCLVVGLGNINVTPDSLGPYVLDNIVVTRHLFELDTVNVGYSEVSGISPGVMGTTGIETCDIIESVTKKIQADYLIVIDALAAASTSRINKTIQITDTGISPGSGVGNKRKELSLDSLGIPVIALGVPTVVDAVTITCDVMDYLIKYLNNETVEPNKITNKLLVHQTIKHQDLEEASNEARNHFMGQIGLLDDEGRKMLVEDVLTPNGYNLMVTPKEIDADVEDLAKIIAMGINITLHESLRESYLNMNII